MLMIGKIKAILNERKGYQILRINTLATINVEPNFMAIKLNCRTLTRDTRIMFLGNS